MVVDLRWRCNPSTVSASPSCPRRRDRVCALALLEQARAGLLATVVARSDKPARMMRLRAVRMMDGITARIVHQRVRIDSAGMTLGLVRCGAHRGRFRSQRIHGGQLGPARSTSVLTPKSCSTIDSRTGYCFHVDGARARRPNQVGLGFRPAKSRGGRIDVDGALVDRHGRPSARGHRVSLPRCRPARRSHFVPAVASAFREMPNGVVVIDHWSIRIVGRQTMTSDPFLPLCSAAHVDGPAGPLRTAPFYGVEVRGELARATWPDGHSWVGTARHASPPARSTREGNRGARHRGSPRRYGLPGRRRIPVGHVELPDLVPGPYAVSIVDPELADA